MQTLSKKRKVEHTFANDEDDDEDDWGNEITAEEFDFIQSQMDAEAATVASTSVAMTKSDLCMDPNESQLIERGEIHILRRKLEEKSKELEMERQEKIHQMQQNLKEHQEEQAKLISKIESLESSIKFKDHELRTEQLKMKKLEAKASQPVQNMLTSQIKMPPQFLNSFTHKANVLHKSSQTEPIVKAEGRETALLRHNHAYNNCKYSLSNSLKNSLNNKAKSSLGGKISPAKHNDFVTHEINLHQTYTESLPKLHLYSTCYCCNKIQLCNYYPAKEIVMFQTYLHHLKEHSNSFFANVKRVECGRNEMLPGQLTVDLPSKGNLSNQSQVISSILSGLCTIINLSPDLCNLLIKSLQDCTDGSISGKDLLSAIAVCIRPVFCNRDVLNKNMVNSSFRVLLAISNHCSYCFSNQIVHVVNNTGIYHILNGSCSVETAFLALKLLEQCTRNETLFIHQNDVCVFKSMVKLMKLCLPLKKSSLQNMEIVILCCNMVTYVILLQGVAAVYNNLCTCVAEVLDQIFKWICNEKVFKERVLISVFHLLQTLYKLLETEKWFELHSRMGSNYVLTLHQVHHCKKFSLAALSEMVKEFWEQEDLSCQRATH